jgi:proteasome lid subunit RPN8/RPN11
MLTEEIKHQIRHLAGQSYPNECCGFLTGEGLLPILNTSEDSLNFARIDPAAYAIAEEQGIIFLYHSHADNPTFSNRDIAACKQLNIPFVLYSVAQDSFISVNPRGGDYIGRDWVWGLQDCYALVRDWYRQERGASLDDFARCEVSGTNTADWNVFLDSFESQGFIRLSPEGIKFQIGDVLLMQIGSANPNHLGIIFDPNKQEFMHHLRDRQSSLEPYGGYWAKHTVGVLRYVGRN